MAEYSFYSVWDLAAPIDRVWDEISSAEGYPQWFPYVKSAREVSPGDENGVGTVVRSRWTTTLPYGFEFETRSTRVQRPHLLELISTGDLEGTGRWELSEYGDITTARYYWTVRTNKPWMNLVAPLAAPAFSWNHAVLMQSGGRGLANRLGVRLLRSQSFTENSTNALIPAYTTAGILTLGLMLGRRIRGLFFRS